MFVLNGAVLLGLRSSSKKVRPDTCDIIGGHAEHGEALDDALIQRAAAGTLWRCAASRYTATKWEGDLINNSCEHTELKWFGIREIRSLKNIAEAQYSMFAQIALKNGFS